MVESGYHHLVVTGAGEKPVGILRVVDLASAEVRNPLVIRRAVDDAATVDDLAAAAALLPSTWLELYDTGVSVMHIAGTAVGGDRRHHAAADRPHRYRRRPCAPPHVMAAAGIGRPPRTAAPLRR